MITIDREKKIHDRTIEISTYVHGSDAVAVEGRLTDNRLRQTWYLSGESRPPGIVHDMVIRMVVKGPGLRIEALDVEMLTVPKEECREIVAALQQVVGMKIRAGFTEKIKSTLGGAKGCSHLVALLLAMAPAAVQGAWAAVAQNPVDRAAVSGAALKFLENTCHVWRSDGPAMKGLKETLGVSRLSWAGLARQP
ncbi:MAG: DUF2889 domain-containing protein [Desulfobacteraceae bacterium]|nr:MAG: DUF2889 domain-containing protein [Desulfobacteraceae bacterium]